MANSQGVQFEGLRKDVAIIVFTLVINIGFFKLTEIEDFAKIFTRLQVHEPSVLSLMIIPLIGICYIVYIFAVGFGIFRALFGQDVRRAMIVAMGAFFVLYVVLLGDAFSRQPVLLANVSERGETQQPDLSPPANSGENIAREP